MASSNGLRQLAAQCVRRVALSLLRTISEFRAFTDVFVPPYVSRVDWHSGLGDAVFVLYSLVRAKRPQVIVEIGSARGRSTCALALACRQNGVGRVYAIDPHSINLWTEIGTAGEHRGIPPSSAARLSGVKSSPRPLQRPPNPGRRPLICSLSTGTTPAKVFGAASNCFGPGSRRTLLSCFTIPLGTTRERSLGRHQVISRGNWPTWACLGIWTCSTAKGISRRIRVLSANTC